MIKQPFRLKKKSSFQLEGLYIPSSFFRLFLVEGMEPNRKLIEFLLNRSLMLLTALNPDIGYDKASQVTHFALDNDLTLKEAALRLGFVTAEEFDKIVDPKKMVIHSVVIPKARNNTIRENKCINSKNLTAIF